MTVKKKLQVFVSSTFLGLKEERQAAVEAILKAGHIPAGMELFIAGNESQLETIKRWIDESDVYMLILGGRYGSLEPKSQLSYTEVEYDYAVSTGTPYFSVVISEEALAERSESDQTLAEEPEKLTAFRDKVLSRTSSFFSEPKDVKLAVMETIADFDTRFDLEGWVKGSLVDNTELLVELNDLRKRTERYREELEVLQTSSHPELASGSDTFELKGKYTTNRNSSYATSYDWSAVLTWDEIFSAIGPELFQYVNQASVNHTLARVALNQANPKANDKYPEVDKEIFETVGIQLRGLGLIEIKDLTTVSKTIALFWRLTDKGQRYLTGVRSVKRVSGALPTPH